MLGRRMHGHDYSLGNFPLLPSAYTYQASSYLSHSHSPLPLYLNGQEAEACIPVALSESSSLDSRVESEGELSEALTIGLKGGCEHSNLNVQSERLLHSCELGLKSDFLTRVQNNLIPPLLATSSGDVAVILNNLNGETRHTNIMGRHCHETEIISLENNHNFDNVSASTSSLPDPRDNNRLRNTNDNTMVNTVRRTTKHALEEEITRREDRAKFELIQLEAREESRDTEPHYNSEGEIYSLGSKLAENASLIHKNRNLLPNRPQGAQTSIFPRKRVDHDSEDEEFIPGPEYPSETDYPEGPEDDDPDSPLGMINNSEKLTTPLSQIEQGEEQQRGSECEEEEEKKESEEEGEIVDSSDAPQNCYTTQYLDVTKLNGTGICGLKNLGNTCFMNSAIQCLSNCPTLTNYFLSERHCVEINDTRSPTKGDLALAFGRLLYKMWTAAPHTSVKPIEVKKLIGQVSSRFSGYRQHDSQEFLRFFLDALHDDLNRVKEEIPYEEIKDIKGESTLNRSLRWWKNYEDRNDSHIKDKFCGQLYSKVICKTCGHESTAFDPFMDLSVPIPKNGNECVKMTDCLDQFTAEETLSGIEQCYCSNCKEHRDSLKTIKLQRLPEVLVIHLKRFSNTRKLGTAVDIPIENLNLEKYCSEDCMNNTECLPGAETSSAKSFDYKLAGVVNHMGSLFGGHYTADCLNHKEGKWYNFNDAMVSNTSTEKISHTNAYVLFYVKQNTY
mmetsp:Transcript_33470/g.41023  ORF Transcript_33470/g.41023 Transcript_33470/m.41023 type:complete len:729 (+) Transcript_33470:380-2566(+)